MSGGPGVDGSEGWPSLARALDPGQVQSEVLRGYARADGDIPPSRGTYLLLRFPRTPAGEIDGRAAQAFLRELAISWGDSQTADGVYLNVGFTYSGIKALADASDVTSASLAAIGKPFEELVATMAARAEILGDSEASSPSGWEFSDGAARADGFGDLDAVVMLFLRSADGDVGRLTSRVLAVEAAAKERALAWLRKECESLAEDREHFGYVDGLVQPAIEGLPGPVEGYGKVDGKGEWRPIRAGELVLGLEDEAGPVAVSPLLEDGSFFVLRKLEQDVRSFHDYLALEAARLGRDDARPERLAAWLMGRDFDGKPLVGDGSPSFRYAPDPDGVGCPFGAHIRRVNPRDTSGRVAERSERHRLVRRSLMFTEDREGRFVSEGVSFGARLRADPSLVDERTRGMLFGCFVASLGRQFEVVQGSWLNGGESAPRRLFTRDPIAGANHSATADFLVPGHPPTVLRDVPQFTTTRGGAYFFVPGREVLRRLRGQPAELSPEAIAARSQSRWRRAPPSPSRAALSEVAQSVVNRGSSSGMRAGRVRREPELSVLRPGHSIRALLNRWRDNQSEVTEDQVIVVMAPLREGGRGAVEALLAERAAIDAALERVTCTHHRDGRGASIHHARFLITSRFYRFNAQESLDDEPDHVPLARGESVVPFLFFACWFDGSRDELLRGLAAQGADLPFSLCHGWPARPQDEPARFASKMCAHELPMLFAYRAYPASTLRIRRALTLRERFIHLVAELSSASPDDGAIAEFFRDWVADGAQPPSRAKREK